MGTVSCLPFLLTVPLGAMRALSVTLALSLMANTVCSRTTVAASTNRYYIPVREVPRPEQVVTESPKPCYKMFH